MCKLYFLLLMLPLAAVVGQSDSSTQTKAAVPSAADDPNIFIDDEVMPVFIMDSSYCDLPPEQCPKEGMMQFIYRNLRYPPEACVEGLAVIQFRVFKDGSVGEYTIVRDPGAGCGQEALRVVQLMNEVAGTWQPATSWNKPVDVMYYIPVKFKLE